MGDGDGYGNEKKQTLTDRQMDTLEKGEENERKKKWKDREEKQWGRLERTFEIELRVDRKFNYVFFIYYVRFGDEI